METRYGSSYFHKLGCCQVASIIGMAQLGSCANVTVKLSGGFATDPHWTQGSAVELIKDTVQLFTPQRYYHTVL